MLSVGRGLLAAGRYGKQNLNKVQYGGKVYTTTKAGQQYSTAPEKVGAKECVGVITGVALATFTMGLVNEMMDPCKH